MPPGFEWIAPRAGQGEIIKLGVYTMINDEIGEEKSVNNFKLQK